MEGDPDKLEVYADILQILRYRSGQSYVLSTELLYSAYLSEKPEEFVSDCVDDLSSGEFPVRHSRGVLELTDAKRAEEIIQEIRGDVYGL